MTNASPIRGRMNRATLITTVHKIYLRVNSAECMTRSTFVSSSSKRVLSSSSTLLVFAYFDWDEVRPAEQDEGENGDGGHESS